MYLYICTVKNEQVRLDALKGDVILTAKPRNIRGHTKNTSNDWEGRMTSFDDSLKFTHGRPKSAMQPTTNTNIATSTSSRHQSKKNTGPILRPEGERIVPQTSAYLQWLRSHSASATTRGGGVHDGKSGHDGGVRNTNNDNREFYSRSQPNLLPPTSGYNDNASNTSDVIDLQSTHDDDPFNKTYGQHVSNNHDYREYGHRGHGDVTVSVKNLRMHEGDKNDRLASDTDAPRHEKHQARRLRPTTAPNR